MPIRAVGHNFIAYGSVFYEAELSASLLGLEVSSAMLPSSVINSPMRLDSKQMSFSLPANLTQGIYALYNYNNSSASWDKIKDYTIRGNKLSLAQRYSGVLLAMPMDALEDTFYDDGEYVYEMYLNRADSRIYRNITIGSASYKTALNLDLLFSFNAYGPWSEAINAQSLFNRFYVKVIVKDINKISKAHTVPSELITISCLTCE